MKPDIGPRHVLIGDPTQALGAGMLDLGYNRRVEVNPTHRSKVAMDATGNENLEGNFYMGSSMDIQFDVLRSVANDIRSVLPMVDSNGDYIARGSTIPKKTLVLVHPDDAAGGAAAESASTRWFPAVRWVENAPEVYDGAEDGGDDSTFVTVTLRTGYVDEDQDENPVPKAAQPDFHGDRLATHGLDAAWSLPDPYGPAA